MLAASVGQLGDLRVAFGNPFLECTHVSFESIDLRGSWVDERRPHDLLPRPTAGYWCEVRAEGEVHGTGETVPYVLGTLKMISLKLALRWLRIEAERLADRLDPDPERST
ncbi:hypothetical protein GCM10028832_29740 [Streptomyces sparsus]